MLVDALAGVPSSADQGWWSTQRPRALWFDFCRAAV